MEQRLLSADGALKDTFGGSVAISGDTVLVGAYRDDDFGNLSGSVYAFSRVGGAWFEDAKLNPGAGAVVQAQLWYRDPASSSNQTSSLSNGVEFVLLP